MNIYVGNLAYGVTDADLSQAFGAFGAVGNATVIKDKFSGQSKGFGFVEMPNNSEANEAIKNLNEKPLKGRNMRVNEAKPREDRPAHPPRRNTGGGYQQH
ncbi:MAG: RNA-binding protein [Gammaproteobacteria bacterium]|nr:RNA-binding protein [Gammaproteobacteria bacterium]